MKVRYEDHDGNEVPIEQARVMRELPDAAPDELHHCPCGVGLTPCPDADGKPLCAKP
jgi:hypothetical protein